MLKKILGCLLSFSLCSMITLPGFSQTRDFSPPEFDHWLTCYYRNPSPQKIPQALDYYRELIALAKQSLKMPFAVFLAELFKQDSTLMYQTYQYIKKGNVFAEQELILYALWLTNTQQSQELIKKAQNELVNNFALSATFAYIQSQPAFNPLTEPLITPEQIDMLWAVYYATRNKQAVIKIIALLDHLRTGEGFKLILGQTAKESLVRNALNHPRVLQICKEEALTAPESLRLSLEAIIAQAETSTN